MRITEEAWTPKRRRIVLKPAAPGWPWPLILASVVVAGVGVASPSSLVLLLPALFAFYKIRTSRWGRASPPTEFAVLGLDGCQLEGLFVAWSSVVEIRAHEDGAALIASGGEMTLVRPADTLDFIELANRYRDAGRERPEVRLPELEWRAGESEDQRAARLERLFSEGDYRDGCADASRLAELVSDPAAPGPSRLTAARLLVRVDPRSAAAVADVAGETAQTVVWESLELLARDKRRTQEE